MKLRIAGIVKESIVDGNGLRYVIFVQGCPHHCPNCHNPEAQSMTGGYEIDTKSILSEIKRDPLLDGVTFTGGEPFLQAEPLIDLIYDCRKMNLSIWCYTGYCAEDLIKNGTEDQLKLFCSVDTIVDGPFIEEKKSLELPFCGSTNQRLITPSEFCDPFLFYKYHIP